MKKLIIASQMLGVFMLVLTGLPLQVLNIDMTKSAHAMGWFDHNGFHGGNDGSSGSSGSSGSNGNSGSIGNSGSSGSNGNSGSIGSDGSGNGYSVPEPGILALLGTGIGGVVLFAFRRRNRDK